ncbi:hypothetical protein [Candidatus Frankia alpina]|uniref:hypothetical protein n=1 Tax=Candidatus Frankia alpina TaxID=2699483 RepID=UPI001F18A4E5|nr:hypothetical protein [Candidatus Frankia alpina]
MPRRAKKAFIAGAPPTSAHRALAAALSLTEIIRRASACSRAVSRPDAPARCTSAVSISSLTELAVS